MHPYVKDVVNIKKGDVFITSNIEFEVIDFCYIIGTSGESQGVLLRNLKTNGLLAIDEFELIRISTKKDVSITSKGDS